jgi:hypothetical protein
MAKGYEYRINGGSAVDGGDNKTIVVPSLTSSTSYNFETRKRDALGNVSAWSAVASGTTSSGGGSTAVVWQGASNMTVTGNDVVNTTQGVRGAVTSTQTIDSTDTTKGFEFIMNSSAVPYTGFFVGVVPTSGGTLPATIPGLGTMTFYLNFDSLVFQPGGNNGGYWVTSYNTTSVVRFKFDASRHVLVYIDGVLTITSTTTVAADTYYLAFFADNDPSNQMGINDAFYLTGL